MYHHESTQVDAEQIELRGPVQDPGSHTWYVVLEIDSEPAQSSLHLYIHAQEPVGLWHFARQLAEQVGAIDTDGEWVQ